MLVALLQEVSALPIPTKGTFPLPWGHRNLPAANHPVETDLVLAGKCLLGSPWCYKSRDHTPAILQHLCVCQKPFLLRAALSLEVAEPIWG